LPVPSSRPRFKAVLFDLDGTLIEFKFDVKNSRAAVIDWLSNAGFKVEGLSGHTRTQDIILWVKRECENGSGKNLPDFDSVHSKISAILDEFEFKAFTIARPHPGSLHLLKELKSDQILSALVTNSGRKPVQGLLNEFGLLPYLTKVITRDEVENLKPDPEGILKAIKLLSISKRDAIYVGDSILDILASKAAGIPCIALAQGLYKAEELAEKKPDFLIKRIEQVRDVIYS
jgi:HAD superfamily hydrolase (TIGR01509 family)